jgi:hypothetical protein
MGKELKQFLREVVITVRDTDIAAGKVEVNATFNPAAKPGEATTPAIELALAMFEMARKTAKAGALPEDEG